MKLSEYIKSGEFILKEAILLDDINLDNGESRKKGDTVTIIKKNPDGRYHAEDNEFAGLLERKDFEYKK